MPKFTNIEDFPLSIAVWLAEDTYDYNEDESVMSATTLIKPIRQTVLKSRITDDNVEANPADLADRIASSYGTAIHDAIEHAWLNSYKTSMAALGYPKSVIDRVLVNPTTEELAAADRPIPVYLERRSHRNVGDLTVSGKFDFVGQGLVDDFKTTGVYKYISGSSKWDFMMQGSIYRWLNTDIITEDNMHIVFIFTDWSKLGFIQGQKKGYPAHRIKSINVDLMSVEETDIWINQRITDLAKYWNAKEAELPLCEGKDLWQQPDTYKYYKSGVKSARSTKNYTSFMEAEERRIDDNCDGLVLEVKGHVKACEYCDAVMLCTQKDDLIASGRLVI